MSVLDFKVKDIDGKDVDLAKYKGEVLLIVNTASKCGYTPQYKGLESTYEKYKDKGFEVLAFPANEFGTRSRGPTPRSRRSAPRSTTSRSRSSRRSRLRARRRMASTSI